MESSEEVIWSILLPLIMIWSILLPLRILANPKSLVSHLSSSPPKAESPTLCLCNVDTCVLGTSLSAHEKNGENIRPRLCLRCQGPQEFSHHVLWEVRGRRPPYRWDEEQVGFGSIDSKEEGLPSRSNSCKGTKVGKW